jgi:hypothetical protein
MAEALLAQCELEAELQFYKGCMSGMVGGLVLAFALQFCIKMMSKGMENKNTQRKQQEKKDLDSDSDKEVSVQSVLKNKVVEHFESIPGFKKKSKQLDTIYKTMESIDLEAIKSAEAGTLKSKNMEELKAMLKFRQLPVSRLKGDLVNRLAEYEIMRLIEVEFTSVSD